MHTPYTDYWNGRWRRYGNVLTAARIPLKINQSDQSSLNLNYALNINDYVSMDNYLISTVKQEKKHRYC